MKKAIRNLARDMALTGLAFQTKLPAAKAVFKKPRVQFLYIHHVFDHEVKKFDELMNELSRHHTFISYSDAVNRILTNEIDKPYIAISSDDGYKNNLNAAKILDQYNAKGCFFITPDTIGLSDPEKNKKFCREKLNFPPTEFLEWNDVDDLLKNGHEIGSHSMAHINIGATDLNEVEENINQSFEMIKSKIGGVEHFAYPYGLFSDFNNDALKMVFKVGFKTCASAERGCHISEENIDPANLLLRRDLVICEWDLNHIMYFVYNASKNCSLRNNLNPYQ